MLLTYRLGVIYAFTSFKGGPATQLLNNAVNALLSTVDVTPAPTVLWSLQFEQQPGATSDVPSNTNPYILKFPPSSTDLAFDDSVLDRVMETWQRIVGDDAGDFLVYEDKETTAEEDE